MNFSFPDCWTIADIENVLSAQSDGKLVHQGWSPQCDGVPAADNEWGVLKTTAIQDGYFLDYENKRLPDDKEPKHRIEVKKGDLLITNAGPRNRCGVICYVRSTRSKLMLSGKMYRLRFPDFAICPEYIEAWLRTSLIQKELNDRKTGISESGLNMTQATFLTLPIMIAPFAEQKVIAEKLDTLLAQVDNTKARLERIPGILKRFRQSVLAAAVSGKLIISDTETWTPKKVDDLVKVVNGKAFPSNDYQENGVRLLRPGNLHMSGAVIWTEKNTTYIPESWKNKRPELILKEGALLMNLTAQSLADEFLGRVCVFSEQNEITLLNQRICSFESKLEYDVKPYLYLVFKSPQFRAFVDTLDSGTLIKHLNVKDVKSYTFLLPQENEQAEIVRRVEELFAFADRIEQAAQAALSRVNNLTQSILAKAFKGELTADWRAANPELISGENSAEALLAKIKAERAKVKPTRKAKAG